jgi:hypothetical protein
MLKWIYFKSDLKRLYREPVMALLFLTPIIVTVVFMLILSYIVPIINNYVVFDITNYYPYILAFGLLIAPGILGIVMGFMMIDDKDVHIVELKSVTRLGKNGHIIIRLTLIFIFTFIYTIFTYIVLGIYLISIGTLLFLTVLLSIYGSLIGMILSNIATDKVKGLTYAKALNILSLFALGDLVPVQWIRVMCRLFPTYWVTSIIMNQDIKALLLGSVMHIIWFVLVINKIKNRH